MELHKSGADSIPFITFSVPWKSRVNSKLLQPSNVSSAFNSWISSPVDSLYSITAVTGIPPSKSTIAYYIEHVQHMVSLGVKHIFLPVQFKWKSMHMIRLIKALRSFINEGLVTITSMSIDGVNFQSAFAGATWNHSAANTIHTLMRAYSLKGVTQFVATPEINQFFIPQSRSDSMLDAVSKSLISTSDCGINFVNKKVLNINNHNNNTESPPESSWIGHKFSHGAEVNDPENGVGSVVVIAVGSVSQLRYSIDEQRFICNAKTATENSGFLQKSGCFYQFLSDEYSTNNEVFLHENDYSKYYSSSVIKELTRRNLDLLIELPREASISCIADDGWTSYKKYFDRVIISNATS